MDISNNQETIYADPNRILARIVEGLPNLVSLDISGTNLAGNGSYESASSAAESRSWAAVSLESMAARRASSPIMASRPLNRFTM